MKTYFKAIGTICGLLAMWLALTQVVDASSTHLVASMQPSVAAPAKVLKLAIDKRERGRQAKETYRV